MKQGKVATVTVTYNRKDLLIKNIEAILNQTYKTDSIIIVDNHSTDNTKQTIMEKFPDQNIEYLYLEENIGGAGGFYTGCKYAFEKEYDWIILMDDDGRPKNEDTFKNSMKVLEDKNLTSDDLVMLNSLVLYDNENLTFGLFGLHDTLKEIQLNIDEKNIILNRINPFNGTIISKGLIKKIGFPNKDFFIRADEQEYQSRALRANAYVATVVNSLYYHPAGLGKNTKMIKIFGKEHSFELEKPWKEYYKTRNHIYVNNEMHDKKANIKLILSRLVSVILCKGEKIKCLKMIIKGYKDGMKGQLGSTVKPS